MSKWTQVRDNVVSALKVEEVTEQVKQNVSQQILSAVIPEIENVVDGFVSEIMEQSKTESGWVRIRDGIVLPLILNGTIYAMKTSLAKSIEKSVK